MHKPLAPCPLNLAFMRLTDQQARLIKEITERFLGPSARVLLFGSRVDDAARGGDIDLYIETDETVPNRIDLLCRLETALLMGLGDRKLDVVLKDGRTPDVPIHDIARRYGVPL